VVILANSLRTSYYPEYFSPETEDKIKLATVTIENFLNYLLYHDVCPEYEENIKAARISCHIASKELWRNQRFVEDGPGRFNRACSTLFGGFFHGLHLEDGILDEKEMSPQMSVDIANKIVRFTLAAAGSDELATLFYSISSKNETNAMKIEDIDGFEVIEVIFPDGELREFYRDYAPGHQLVGKLRCKSYRDPARPEFDLSPAERAEWDQRNAPSYEFEFLLEEGLLEFCYPGMKVITSVWKLNCGLYFFDEVISVYCSIYTVLSNDIMLNWKNPRAISVAEYDNRDEAEGDEHEI
jgi:hypothetical protein